MPGSHDASGTRSPVVLFGAFDRHNVGDLLFPHVATALLPGRALHYAGLVARDLRGFGGHRVGALPEVLAGLRGRCATVVHVGGEILTCDAWQAAVMLSEPGEAQRIVARLDARPWRERLQWAHGVLGTRALAPYTMSRAAFPAVARVVHAGIGGVDLDAREPGLRDEVLANLAAADAVGVRDERTLAHLEAAGVRARLMPDPAVMVAELFGVRVRRRARQGEVAQVRAAFPHGHLAVQFSADFGDDASLSEIAAQLDRVVAATGCGVALFRAGAAPWHDDLDSLRRVAQRMRASSVRVFESLDVWDICALIASARAYCGSSLHGRIVAMAFALPRVNLCHPSCAPDSGKQAAFAATWDEGGFATIGVARIAETIVHMLGRDRLAGDRAGADRRRLRDQARRLAALYREEFARLGAASA